MEKGLAVSLPSRELRKIEMPGSVTEPAALAQAAFSPELRAAMNLLEASCTEGRVPLRYIGRPEIFTHDPTLAWLRGALGDIEDHVCLSDGSVIKLIPGMRNHLFHFAHGLHGGLKSFENLIERAPEIATQLESQINTAFSFFLGGTYVRPRTQLIQALSAPSVAEAPMRKCYLNPNSVEDSVNRMALFPTLGLATSRPGKHLIFVPFTDAAYADRDFCRIAAELVIRCAQEHSDSLLILAALAESQTPESWALHCKPLISAIAQCGRILPRAVLSNVAFCAGMPTETCFAGWVGSTFVCHETFCFWQQPRAFYEGFSDIRLVLGRHRRRDTSAILDMFAAACGRQPTVTWGSKEEERPLMNRYAYA